MVSYLMALNHIHVRKYFCDKLSMATPVAAPEPLYTVTQLG